MSSRLITVQRLAEPTIVLAFQTSSLWARRVLINPLKL